MNPFEKYIGAEDRLQHQVTTTCRMQYPKIKYHHSPDAGKRTAFQQFMYKFLGCDSGFPDLMFPELLLVIELKVGKNKPTQNQIDWLNYFKSIGWFVFVCYDYDDAMMRIKQAHDALIKSRQ